MTIQLIVGLGNPGPEYERTRHNAGAILVEQFAASERVDLVPEKKFFGRCGRFRHSGEELRLFIPSTYMNESGQAVSAIVKFFKIPVDAIMIVHDEIDLPPGTARLKKGGGPGGHNGLKDIIQSLGNQNQFCRLRIGVGHPGNAAQVPNYVLKKAPADQQQLIDESIDRALDILPMVLEGQWDKAMQRLHTKSVPSHQSPVARKGEPGKLETGD